MALAKVHPDFIINEPEDLTVSNFDDLTIVTESDEISSNDNDTTIPTSAAVKDYVDDNALLNVEDQTIIGGARVTSKDLGTPAASSTVTLDPGDRPLQHLTNNAAFTLEPGSNTGSLILEITNTSTAGTITTSGFTYVVGAFTTTDSDKFLCSVIISENYSLLSIQVLQ